MGMNLFSKLVETVVGHMFDTYEKRGVKYHPE